jgi:hypothetical protein
MDVVVWNQLRGYSPDEVVLMFPEITLSDVHAALAYCFDNRQEIDEEFRQDADIAKDFLERYRSKLQGKMSA